ncbi:unnamed protein product [Plutella xylostella]|uniref:(diamondback moth) hypothetical protein n=1 Tax=Plutella xylostella TaxID=51655 RepID=A0A8S4FWS8_PLUXY|nr:unnamed protein product [Plutella xylostella]
MIAAFSEALSKLGGGAKVIRRPYLPAEGRPTSPNRAHREGHRIFVCPVSLPSPALRLLLRPRDLNPPKLGNDQTVSATASSGAVTMAAPAAGNDSFRGGQLRRYFAAWSARRAPPHILKVIQGYRIPFILKPPLRRLSNQSSFPLDCSSEMQMEVQKMAAQGVIERASQGPGFESHLFLVKKSDGSHRPVLNLKALNNFLVSGKFRLVNMYKVPYFLQPNDWMMKIDLSQAYFHVPVAESHRRFLRFVAPCGHPSRCPEDPPQHCVWQMTSLPFGLASAPRTFATLSNWVAQQLRLRGMRVLVYLDDYLLVNQSRRRLRDHAHQAKALLHELGWVINKGKSSAQPVQNIEFLGIEWSTVQNIKSLPREKLFKLQGCLEKFLVAPAWSPLDLQKLVGWLNFASFIVPYGRINFRSLLTLMQRAVREGISVAPTAQAVVDLQWWMNHFKEVSEIWLQPPTHFIVTDASDVGWGAYVDGHYLQGPWLAQETSFRANRKELLAISFVLQNMAQVFADKTILVQSDNQTALAYLRNQGGTRSESLLSIARNIYTHLMTHRIHLMTSYIPGPLNSVADSLSRFKALPEWHLLPIATRLIFRKWGIPIIDLFASQNAHVVPRYVTRDLRDPAADFHDAFSRTWTYKLAWIFPPPCLMHQVLYAMNQAQGKYIVICPRWLNVFWRADLKARALCPPFTIHNLHRVLKDTTTGQPPPQVDRLVLEAWLIRGGTSCYMTGPLHKGH